MSYPAIWRTNGETCLSPWQSDHCCWDWNGTAAGWLFSCHRLPVAVTWPLSQACGLIQSQRRGHWLLPGLREDTLGITREGVGQEGNVFFRPFYNEIQRLKVNCLPNWEGPRQYRPRPLKLNGILCALNWITQILSILNACCLNFRINWIGF